MKKILLRISVPILLLLIMVIYFNTYSSKGQLGSLFNEADAIYAGPGRTQMYLLSDSPGTILNPFKPKKRVERKGIGIGPPCAVFLMKKGQIIAEFRFFHPGQIYLQTQDFDGMVDLDPELYTKLIAEGLPPCETSWALYTWPAAGNQNIKFPLKEKGISIPVLIDDHKLYKTKLETFYEPGKKIKPNIQNWIRK